MFRPRQPAVDGCHKGLRFLGGTGPWYTAWAGNTANLGIILVNDTRTPHTIHVSVDGAMGTANLCRTITLTRTAPWMRMASQWSNER